MEATYEVLKQLQHMTWELTNLWYILHLLQGTPAVIVFDSSPLSLVTLQCIVSFLFSSMHYFILNAMRIVLFITLCHTMGIILCIQQWSCIFKLNYRDLTKSLILVIMSSHTLYWSWILICPIHLLQFFLHLLNYYKFWLFYYNFDTYHFSSSTQCKMMK